MENTKKDSLIFWTSSDQERALMEGWCLAVVDESALQVQKIDEVEEVSKEVGFAVPELRTDEDAMLKIFFGTKPHHLLARKVLKEIAPEEWAQVLSSVADYSRPRATTH